MNLYFRLLWTLLRVRFLRKLGIDEVFEREFRVLPNDLDLNGHMNNGRYLTLLDLMLIEYFARIGFLKVLLKNGWRPMSGGAVVTYRKGLKPFQRYSIRFSLAGSNAHWNFMKFEFVDCDDRICAAGYIKGAAVSKQGFVPNQIAFGKMGIDFEQKPLPAAIMHWLASEQAVASEWSVAK
ncbi:MAG: acyl-CoA thioesterase [Pseudomonadota bacterium]